MPARVAVMAKATPSEKVWLRCLSRNCRLRAEEARARFSAALEAASVSDDAVPVAMYIGPDDWDADGGGSDVAVEEAEDDDGHAARLEADPVPPPQAQARCVQEL